jgi:hypothetical protein
MPSKKVYLRCLGAGFPVDKNSYERYDSLASEDDLELLFELLQSYKDKNANHPIITANCVVANPDFEEIKAHNFQNYFYELLTVTFKRYPKHSKNFELWKQGIKAGIFHPQYHGREHLNVSLFMNDLRRGEKAVHFGFDNQMPGCIPMGNENKGNPYVEATRYISLEDKAEKLTIFLEGLDLFQNLFGFRSETVIPANYIWSPDYDKYTTGKGVKYYQGLRKMTEPVPGGKSKSHSYYLGAHNNFNQTYLVRNAIFEPSLFNSDNSNAVDRCLSDISIAFRMNKPALISSHRVNYVGFIDMTNRDRTLKMLRILLTTALKYWPEIEFMTSDQLGRHIINHKSI